MNLNHFKSLDLLGLPKQAIIALRDNRRKRVYLTFTHSLLTGLDRVRSIIETSSSKSFKNSVVVIHPCCFLDRNHALLDLAYYEQYYLDLGYSLYKRLNGLYYKLDLEIGSRVIYVVLTSRNRSKQVIGVFDKMDEANSFIDEFYKGKKILSPVVCNNSLTMAYFVNPIRYRTIPDRTADDWLK